MNHTQGLAYFNSTIRSLLHFWARIGIAPGYLYQVCEIWGRELAENPLEARLFNGCKMTCDLKDHIQRQIYYFGAFEPVEAYLFRQLLQPGMIVIDVGANVGQYTLIAAKAVGKSGKTYAFEPVPSNFEMLSRYVYRNNLNSIVQMENLGLWSKNEILKFSLYDTEVYDNATDYIAGEYDNAVKTIECLAIKLDDYISQKNISQVDLIKMDIEGSEYFALQGATETIKKFSPIFLMEINRENCTTLGYKVDVIWDFFREFNYKMWKIGSSANCSHVLEELVGIERANVIFYPNELPENVTSGWTLKNILRSHRKNADRKEIV